MNHLRLFPSPEVGQAAIIDSGWLLSGITGLPKTKIDMAGRKKPQLNPRYIFLRAS
ncbi:MAG: hypothetical protein GXO88_13970 [Chlorobi bacterium]|nr:hypothetical protein [Chlorobiota bacterium]